MSWTELLKITWTGPLITGLLTGAIAIFGIYLTHWGASTREDRNRVIKEKREAYIGSLDALTAFRNADSEVRLIDELISNNRKAFNEAANAYEVNADADEDIAELARDSMAHFKQKIKDLLEKHQEKTVVSTQAYASLLYWTSRVDIACSPDGSQLLKALIDTTPDESGERRYKYVEFIKRDLRSHKILRSSCKPYVFRSQQPDEVVPSGD